MNQISDELFDVSVLQSDTVFAGRVWNIRRDTFELSDEILDRDYVAHTSAVGVLALDDSDRVLLIKQYRHPVARRMWEIPAGLLDIHGEAPLVAAKRELAEETDLQARSWAVLIDFATTPGGSNEWIRVYLARGISVTGRTFAREAEEAQMETCWLPLAECVTAVLKRRIANGPLALAVLAAMTAQTQGWSNLGDPDLPFPTRPR